MTVSDFTTPDGCRLTYEREGQGPVVVWQHGLGAPFEQPRAVFPTDLKMTRLTLACRGHETSDLGPPSLLSVATFTNDLVALLDHLAIEQVAAAGGISLGAGISLRLAARHPSRVARLILARPAYVDHPSLETQQLYVRAGEYLETYGADGRQHLLATPEFKALERVSPDNAKSLLGYFSRPRPETTIALLARLPKDYPGIPLEEIRQLALPTLVIGNGEDVVHPLAYAEQLAAEIPEAKLAVVTSKTVDASRYQSEFSDELRVFLSGAR